MRHSVIAGVSRIVRQRDAALTNEDVAFLLVLRHIGRKDEMAKHPVNTGRRMFHDRDFPVPGPRAHPCPERLLAKPGRGRVPARNRGQPVVHLGPGDMSDRHEHHRHTRPHAERPHTRPAVGFKIRNPVGIERVDPRQSRSHGARVPDLFIRRGGILCLCPGADRGRERAAAEKGVETGNHLVVAQVVVVEMKGRLARELKRSAHPLAKPGPGLQKAVELRRVEAHPPAPGRAEVAQPPLPGLARDLERQVAVERIARQNDLGTARVGKHRPDCPLVMAVEDAEARDAVRHGGQRCKKAARVLVARAARDAQRILPTRRAHEMRIEKLAVTGNPGMGGQKLFQQVRSGAHPGKDGEDVETSCHVTAQDRGAPPPARRRRSR